VHLLFDGEKSAKPTAAPLFLQPVFELHLRVEFKTIKKAPKMRAFLYKLYNKTKNLK